MIAYRTILKALVTVIIISAFLINIDCYAVDYELRGHVLHEMLGGDGRPFQSVAANFSVSVRDCSWYLSTKSVSRSGHSSGGWEVGCSNGAEVFELSIPSESPSALTNSANQRASPGQHSQAIILSNQFPWSISAETVPHLWLMFASGCYLRGVTNSRLPSLFENSLPVAERGITSDAEWELLTGGPGLPGKIVCFSDGIYATSITEGKVKYTRFPYPYDVYFTNAMYDVTGTTNLGAYSLPTGFVFNQFVPGSGKNNRDLKLRARLYAVVTNAVPFCTRTNFVPVMSGRTVIMDRRLARAQPPIGVMLYNNAAHKEWLQVEEARKVYEQQQRR